MKFILILLLIELIYSQCDTFSNQYPFACERCLAGYVLYSNICYACNTLCTSCTNGYCDKCVDGYYGDQYQCSKCSLNCLACNSNLDCTNCVAHTYNNAGLCSLCSSICKTCTQSPDQCTSCYDGYVLSYTSCIPCTLPCHYCKDYNYKCTDCLSGYYLNNEYCWLCPYPCKICNSASSCQTCQQGFYLDSTCKACSSNCLTCSNFYTCLTCQSGYYVDPETKQCIQCKTFDSNCYQCSGYNKCTICAYGFYIETISHSGVFQSALCQHCANQCITCLNSSTECLICNLSNQSPPICMGNCGSNQYSQGMFCLDCDSKCQTCYNDANNCLSCSTNRVSPPECNCDLGYFDNSGSCLSCGLNCEYCTNELICKRCVYPYYIQNGLCIQTCDLGYYQRNDFTCILCEISNCEECDKYGQCIQCMTSYLLYQNACYFQLCADGMYTVDNVTCLNCDMNCYTCINENDNCLTCKTESFWISENSKGKCIQECPLHYYTDGISCMICSNNCQECTNYSNCTSCVSGQYLLNSKCYDNCPDNYYQIDQQCKQCPINCATCYEFYCFTCEIGYFIYNNKCIQNCDDGYYFSINQCLKCNKICKTCTNGTECTSCSSPLYLENNTCLGTCPKSFFRDSNDNECHPCIQGCEICEDQQFCHKCLNDYAQFQKKCVSECDIGYYVEDQYCRECHIYCYTCNGPTIYDCVKCKNGLYEYESMCVVDCPETTVQINGQCVQCYDSCQSCTNSGQGNCLTCKEDYIFLNHGCYAYCPSQYYKQNNQCLECLGHCDICINNLTCIKCLTSYYYDGVNCVSQCAVGYYGYDGLCGRCHFSCKTCDGPLISNCLSCTSPRVLHNGECLPGCPNFFYQTVGLTCSHCLDQCDVCTSSSLCTYCTYGKYQLSQSCVDTCNNGYMTNYVNRSCISCYSGCRTCYGQASNQCLTCFTSLKFYQSQCLSVCPSKTYESFGTCIDCHSNCNTCDQASLCLNCVSNYYYFNEQCLLNCPEGYFKDAGQICTKCSDNCRVCTSVSVCTECYNHYTGLQDYFLFTQVCVSTCPQTIDYSTFSCTNELVTMSVQNTFVIYCPTCSNCYFNISLQKCIQCDSSCLTCYSEYPGQCLTCVNLFQDHYCVANCDYGYYQSGSQCLQCHKSCLTCLNSNRIDNCLTCNNVYLQLVGSNTGRCVASCDDHYLPDINNPINGQIRCSTCDYCYDCYGFQYYQCLNCPSGYFLSNLSGQCVLECPVGYYKSKLILECLKCKDTCYTCDNAYSCILPGQYAVVYQQNGQVYHTCDDGYYASTNRICQLCESPCLRCSNATTCTGCDSNSILYNNYCVSKCPNHYYYDSGSCYSCDSTCLTCFDSSNHSCLTCSSDRIYQVQYIGSQYYGYCVATCAANYSQDPLNNRCTPSTCDSSCLTCLANEPYFCLRCHDGQIMNPLPYSQGNLYYGFCVYSCPSGKYNQNGTCQTCHYLCTQCSDATNYCPSCISTAYRLNDEQCVMQCPLGYYGYNMQCIRCASDCMECALQQNVTYNNVYYTTYVLCLIQQRNPCSSGYFEIDGHCLKCHWSCITCQGKSQYECTTCGTIYSVGNMQNTESRFYYYGQCVAQCPVGSVQNNTKCLYCDQNCETCNSTAQSYCQSCYFGRYLLNGSCLTDCGDYYYPNNLTQKCDPCYYGCVSCIGSGPYQCLSCKSGFYLSDSRCLPGCPYQYYFDFKLAKCIYCNGYILDNACYTTCPLQYVSKNENCILCTDNCTTCNGLFLYQNKCVSSCNQGMYNNNGQCQNCDVQCKSCTKQADNCTVCVSDNRTPPPKCDCLIGYYEDSSTCVQCHIKCHSCIIYYNNCTECKPDRIQNPPQCTCPYGTYDNNGVCTGCPFVCDDCLSSSICLFCKGDRVGRTCLCRIGMYDDGVSDYCKICDHTCTTCNISGCLNCRGNRQMQNHLCKCPIGYYEDGESFNCPQCDFKCQQCSQEACITCRGDRQLPQCICPDGYYDDEVSDSCQQCQVECVTCTKASCLLCKTNRAGSICDCPPGGVDRQDVGIMYCETCQIGTPIIQMQLDLITLIVKFGKQVTFDGECNFMDISLLGIDPQCYINDQYQIVIVLGIDNKIKIGQEIQISNIRALECDLPFPEILPTKILPPHIISSSDLIIFGPEQVNTCNQVTFYVGDYFFDARNGFQMVKWIINTDDIKINALLTEANLLKNTTVNIPAFILQEDVIYTFTYQFINYLGTQQSKSYSVKCISAALPHIEIQNYYQQPLIYHLDNIIVIRATITLQTCSDGTLTESFNNVYYKQRIKYQSTVVSESAYDLITSNYIEVTVNPYTISKEGYYQLFIIATFDKENVTEKSIYLKMLSRGLYAKIYGGNQMHNYANSFKLTAVLKDLDIASQEVSTYSWTCTNLITTNDCITSEGQLLNLNQKSLIQSIGNKQLEPYDVYKFTIRGQKNGHSVIDSVIVSIVDLDIPTLLLDAPHLTLNNGIKYEQQLEFTVNELTDNIYGSLFYDYNQLTTFKIPYYQFAITLSQYLEIRYDQVLFKVALNNGHPMPSVASISLTILRPPLLCKLNVSPQQGIAYETIFTIKVTGCIDEYNPILYKFLYYYNQTEYQLDIQNSLTLSANLLSDYQLSNTYSTLLPKSSVSHSVLIVLIKNSRGAQLNMTCIVIVGNDSDDILLKQNLLKVEVKQEQLKNKYDRLLTSTEFSQLYSNALTLKQDERIALLNILAIGVSMSDSSGLQYQLLNQLQADSKLPLITKATQTQIYKSISKIHNALIYSLSDYTTLLNILKQNIDDSISQFQQLTNLIYIQQASDQQFEQRNLQLENLLVYVHSLNAIFKSLDNYYFNISQGNRSLISSFMNQQFNQSLELLAKLKSGIFLSQFVNANPITYQGSAFSLILNRITSQKLSEYLTIEVTQNNEIFNYSYTHYFTNPFILNPYFPQNVFFTTIQSIEPMLQNGSIIVPQQPVTTKYLITKYKQTRLLQQFQDTYYLDYSPDVVHYSCINYFWLWQTGCLTSYEVLNEQLFVICDCQSFGPTSVSSLISEITIQEKFPKIPPIVPEVTILNFEYKKSVVMYSLVIFTAIFVLLLLYGYKKDQMEKDRAMPEHLIESEYIRKIYEEKKKAESPAIEGKTIFGDRLNDDIVDIAITPDIDPDEMLEELKNNEDNSDNSIINDSEEIDSDGTSKKLPKFPDIQPPLSPQPYQSLQGKDSLNNTLVKRASPPNNEEDNQAPVMKQPKKSIIKERQSSRQASEQFSIRQQDTLQHLIVNRPTENQNQEPQEQPASPKINSMLYIDHQNDLLNSEQAYRTKKNDIENSPKRIQLQLEIIEEDKKSLEEKEKIVQLWYLEQRRIKLLEQGYQLRFTFRNLINFITLFNQLMQIFKIFDKQLPRVLRFCLLYMTLLSTCTINLIAEVELRAGSTIAYCVITALLSFTELLTLKFLLVNCSWLRMFGWLIFLTLTAIYMYLIAHIMELESEGGNITRSNEWGINFIICFFTTYLIIDPIFLIIGFLIFQWSFNTPVGKLKELIIKFMNNKHLNIYFDLLDQ